MQVQLLAPHPTDGTDLDDLVKRQIAVSTTVYNELLDLDAARTTWTVGFDRARGAPGSASFVDSEEGYWRVELDAEALRLVPTTPSEVWDDLAVACDLR